MTLRLTAAQAKAMKDRIHAATKVLNVALEPKYHNRPADVDGIRFDSKREVKRWKELRLLLKGGQIPWLARQAEFILPAGIIYRADFLYPADNPLQGPGIVIEDVKVSATRTKDYKLKKRLMAAAGFSINEV